MKDQKTRRFNYLDAKKKAKEKHEQNLKDIELCNEVAKKISPLLPKGWKCNITTVCFDLEIRKGGSTEETDAIEFKTVCKLVETMTGEKPSRRARVNVGEENPWLLEAEQYFQGEMGGYIGIEISLYYPKNMPDCKITWKRTWKNVAQVSDECLGLS